MIRNKRLHRTFGVVLLTPLLTWTLTGLVFLIQPGYGSAYESLPLKTYPLEQTLSIRPNSDWLEYRVIRTLLGDHLFARTLQGWQHLDATTQLPFEAVTDAQALSLVKDAIAQNPERYGQLEQTQAQLYITSTGVEIRLDRDTLTLQQYGNDTRWIDRLYRLHYLQWTGLKWPDRILGIAGLLLLMLISVTGFKLLFRSRH